MKNLLNVCYWIGLWLFLNNLEVTISAKVNITYFGNCDDILVPKKFWPITLVSVEYEKNPDNFIDTVHGKYEVLTDDLVDDRELLITTYNCPINTGSRCNMNRREFVEDLNCEKFHSDDSNVWRMLSRGIKGSDCGHRTGIYELNNSKLLISDIQKYLVDEKDGTYRIFMLFHRKGESLGNLYVRGCVDLEFDIFY